MTMVSISEAAKLAGISRNHFYKKYLNTGVLSVSRNEAGKVCIDTSELIRVFTVLHSEETKITQSDSHSETVLLEKIKGLEALLRAKDDELESYRERERHLYHLLESKPKKRKWFGLF